MKLAHTALIAAAAGVLTVTLAGCSAPTNGERSPAFAAAESLQPSEASAASIGVYEGLLPCGDCAGLRTTIYVRADGTYTRRSKDRLVPCTISKSVEIPMICDWIINHKN